jgi:hypothetical protein
VPLLLRLTLCGVLVVRAIDGESPTWMFTIPFSLGPTPLPDCVGIVGEPICREPQTHQPRQAKHLAGLKLRWSTRPGSNRRPPRWHSGSAQFRHRPWMSIHVQIHGLSESLTFHPCPVKSRVDRWFGCTLAVPRPCFNTLNERTGFRTKSGEAFGLPPTWSYAESFIEADQLHTRSLILLPSSSATWQRDTSKRDGGARSVGTFSQMPKRCQRRRKHYKLGDAYDRIGRMLQSKR